MREEQARVSACASERASQNEKQHYTSDELDEKAHRGTSAQRERRFDLTYVFASRASPLVPLCAFCVLDAILGASRGVRHRRA